MAWFHDSAGEFNFYQMSLSKSESTLLHKSKIYLYITNVPLLVSVRQQKPKPQIPQQVWHDKGPSLRRGQVGHVGLNFAAVICLTNK